MKSVPSQADLSVLIHPHQLETLPLETWDRLIPLSRDAGILGRLYPTLYDNNGWSTVPFPVQQHIRSEHTTAHRSEQMIRWEINRVQRALDGLDIILILLKGAAYVWLKLPSSRGRRVADVDILVPYQQLDRVEQTLRQHGWVPVVTDDYDQHYYRTWMHELPPLCHQSRKTIIDIHHTILPETSRLKPDPQLLIDAAQPVAPGLAVLVDTDLVLHCAAHAFHDGELSNALRDLLDLDALFNHFGGDPTFWDNLVARAQTLDLERPLFYALYFCQRVLGTSMPPTLLTDKIHRPSRFTCRVMTFLLDKSLPSIDGRTDHLLTNIAQWLLYIRSHWLRMPPLLLCKHLLYKAFKRFSKQFFNANQTTA